MDNLTTNFGKRKVNKTDKTKLVQNIFSKVSKKYNLMNDIMSFGAHRLWKKELISMMQIQNNEIIIDVGSGTGDLIKYIRKENDPFIYCIDLNEDMLNEGKKNYNTKNNKKIRFIKANAEKLPFKSNFFDKYVISFCLRNITYTEKALDEAYRVLKPGGIFYCLEFSTPNSNLINFLYSKYKKKIIPKMGEKISNNKNAYKYLEESISVFFHQDLLLNKMKNSGFDQSSYTNLFNGIVSIHKGFKI